MTLFLPSCHVLRYQFSLTNTAIVIATISIARTTISSSLTLQVVGVGNDQGGFSAGRMASHNFITGK